ncbi:glycoside hydrolase family 3 protein [Hydnum rufescens UP504]|uniref:beta-glucosidase n=1 Tax=Hydnum rufescens UP504 TaxID=1448309 RepID=A0A9P6AQU5_9AGAM|nr:glycoside hydrolase family 3 protein [Hydnum rufescens UP504]
MDPPPFPKLDVNHLMQKLTSDEKIMLTAGRDAWHTVPIKQFDIPSIRTSDGPNGVRGTRFFESVPSSCFPCGTGLGASWDADLLHRVGKALAAESKVKGVHVLLAPTVNIPRSPVGGRTFEPYSEDPFLSGMLARGLIKGLQGEGIGATMKHLVANDQEFERYSISSEVPMRALREIHLRPFELAIRCDNPPWAVMTGYNRVNGLHCSEDTFLLSQVLRREWNFKGLIMSDWGGAYSSTAATRAGLDLEMPGPTVFRGVVSKAALGGKKISQQNIDAGARNLLELVNKVQESGVPEDASEESIDTPEVRALMREAASSAVVLLKNQAPPHQRYAVLPLLSHPDTQSIAIIGPNAKIALLGGGGSASLRATYSVTPFDAISAAAKGAGITDVKYARGANGYKFVPLFGPELVASNGKPGVDLNFFNENPFAVLKSKPVYHVVTTSTFMFFSGDLPSTAVNLICWVEVTGKYTPDVQGDHEFGLASGGRAYLYIDGQMIIDNWTNPVPGESFANHGSTELRATRTLNRGQQYNLSVRYFYEPPALYPVGSQKRGGIRFGVAASKPQQEFIDEAVTVAQNVDKVILLLGLDGDYECEGYDRPDMKLPDAQNSLASAVLEANPKTIVVVQSGAPVEMPWADQASGILQAFYGGNEGGNGIADILFGKVNPSGRLPLTFPKRFEDNPTYLNFGKGHNGKVHYGEGLFVGYRYYESTKLAPLFPFGFGKSYSYFSLLASLSSPKIGPNETIYVDITVKHGSWFRPGREVVQVYVQDVESSLQRPIKELKGFVKTPVLQPGESREFSVPLDRVSLGFFDDHEDVNQWVAEKGRFKVYVVGSTETETKELDLELTESFSWI